MSVAPRPTGLNRASGDPFLEDFFRRIPRDVAANFTDDQLLAIRMAFGGRERGAHAVDIRLSLPLPFKRMYMVLLLGSERRTPTRRRQDRARQPLATAGNFIAGTIVIGVLVVALLGTLYLMKSALGIDLLPDATLGLWSEWRLQWREMVR